MGVTFNIDSGYQLILILAQDYVLSLFAGSTPFSSNDTPGINPGDGYPTVLPGPYSFTHGNSQTDVDQTMWSIFADNTGATATLTPQSFVYDPDFPTSPVTINHWILTPSLGPPLWGGDIAPPFVGDGVHISTFTLTGVAIVIRDCAASPPPPPVPPAGPMLVTDTGSYLVTDTGSYLEYTP